MYCFVDPGPEKHSPANKFGLRLFKPIAQRILEMRSKLKSSAEHSNDSTYTRNSFLFQLTARIFDGNSVLHFL